MRPGMKTVCGAILFAPTLLLMTWGGGRSLGDEPGRLGRLFRFGGGGSASVPTQPTTPRPEPSADATRFGSPLLFDAATTPPRWPKRKRSPSAFGLPQ